MTAPVLFRRSPTPPNGASTGPAWSGGRAAGRARLGKELLLAAVLAFAAAPGLAAQGFPSIRGVVRDSGGVPLAGAVVSLADREAVTDDQGVFRLDDVPSGLYVIAVRLVGYLPYRTRVTIQARQPVEVVYTLARAVTLLPTVVVEATRTGIYGTVGDSILRPVPGALVQVLGARGGEVLTDSAGRFSFPQADRGVYVVRVTLEGHRERRLTLELEHGTGRELLVRLMPTRRAAGNREVAAFRELGLRLSSGLDRERLTPFELERFGSTGLCELSEVRSELRAAGPQTTVILNGVTVLEEMDLASVCAWRANEVELVEFGRDICKEVTHTVEAAIPRVWCSGRTRNVRRSIQGTGERLSTQAAGGSYIVIWEKR